MALPQILDRVLRCYRIGDPAGAYPIFDATGSTLFPGRWNTPASPVIYTSEYYSTALLEKLAQGSGELPENLHYIEITIPGGVSYETFSQAHALGWDSPAAVISKAYGEAWQFALRSLILIVPSVVARVDNNVLINPGHPEFPRITYGLHQPVWWDARLFGSSP